MTHATSGCYKVYTEAKSWTDAKAFCEDSTPAGFNGALAAARTQEEHNFLLNVAGEVRWGMTFWMSGNSVPSSRSQGHWSWGAPYYLDVRFRNTDWSDGMIVNTLPRGGVDDSSYLLNKALVNGHRGAYAWKIANTTETHPFICRKTVCEDGRDVLNGLCSTQADSIVNKAEEEEASKAWIVGIVILAFVLAIAMAVLVAWKIDPAVVLELWASIRGCSCCREEELGPEMLSRRASNLSRMSHHSSNPGMSDDFIAPFVGPDKRARKVPDTSGAFMGGAFNAPVSPTELPDIRDASDGGRSIAVDPFAALQTPADPFADKPGTPAIRRPSMGGPIGGMVQRRPAPPLKFK